MLKKNELSLPESCFNRAEDREPIFVLLGRDVSSPVAIRAWCGARVLSGKNKRTDEQIASAMALADDMDAFRAEREEAKARAAISR